MCFVGLCGASERRMTIHDCTAGWVGMGLLLSVCRPASGLEVLDGFQFHGFASQSYLLTSDNNLFGDSDEEGSLDFTEAGLNVSWVPLPALQIAAQGLFDAPARGMNTTSSWTTGWSTTARSQP